jgi:hypothetical protein
VHSPTWPWLATGVIAILSLLVALAVPATLQPAGGAGGLMVTGLTPADGARLPNRPLTISAEVAGERPLQRVSVRLNGEEVTLTREPRDARRWRVSYTLKEEALEAALRAGEEQRVALLVRDVHGRQISRSWRFRLDAALSAPAFIELQPPNDGFAPAGGARIGAVVESDAPISAATLQINGQGQPVTLQPAGGARTVVAARIDLKPGVYQAALAVTDREGDRGVRRWRFTVPDPRELLAFEQTGKAIGGGFRRFWQEKGGEELFGLPISDELREGGLTVQYFERARFEYHARGDGLLSEVQLGLLGRDLRAPDPARPDPGGGDGRYFPETGQTIAGPFRRFWEEKGGLAIFGLPITAEARAGGAVVQYFERARFELYPGNSAVVLGPVGREVYERRYGPTGGRGGS